MSYTDLLKRTYKPLTKGSSMLNYVCKYSLYHDKPVGSNNEPSSNNGFIYTATALNLGKPVNLSTVEILIKSLFINVDLGKHMFCNRLPNKPLPPMSKDEVIGIMCLINGDSELKMTVYNKLKSNNFNFCNTVKELPKQSILDKIKSLYSLYKVRNEHRNYFWKNNMVNTYWLTFSLPLHDRYFVKRMVGDKIKPLERIAFYLHYVSVVVNGDKSSKLLLWNQLTSMNRLILRKLLPTKKVIGNYFSADHVFNKG